VPVQVRAGAGAGFGAGAAPGHVQPTSPAITATHITAHNNFFIIPLLFKKSKVFPSAIEENDKTLLRISIKGGFCFLFLLYPQEFSFYKGQSPFTFCLLVLIIQYLKQKDIFFKKIFQTYKIHYP
jgi:hypothetical protein